MVGLVPQDCVYLREACPLLLETLNALAPEKIIWAQEMRGIEEDRSMGESPLLVATT